MVTLEGQGSGGENMKKEPKEATENGEEKKEQSSKSKREEKCSKTRRISEFNLSNQQCLVQRPDLSWRKFHFFGIMTRYLLN
jgi:hypothetical protein